MSDPRDLGSKVLLVPLVHQETLVKKVKRGVWDPQVLGRGKKVPQEPLAPRGHLELLSLAPLAQEVNLVSGQN